MTISVLTILFAILTIACIYAGIRKGMLTILFVAFSWVFVVWLINTASPYIVDYLESNTLMEMNIKEKISERITIRYESSEEKEPGTGSENILKLLPSKTREEIRNSVQNTMDQLVNAVSTEITETIMKVLGCIISIIIAILIVWMCSKLIRLVGSIPGIRGVNKTLGFLAGFIEALLIIWAVIYIAECFPNTILGNYVVSHSQDNVVMVWLTENNFIKALLS